MKPRKPEGRRGERHRTRAPGANSGRKTRATKFDTHRSKGRGTAFRGKTDGDRNTGSYESRVTARWAMASTALCAFLLVCSYFMLSSPVVIAESSAPEKKSSRTRAGHRQKAKSLRKTTRGSFGNRSRIRTGLLSEITEIFARGGYSDAVLLETSAQGRIFEEWRKIISSKKQRIHQLKFTHTDTIRPGVMLYEVRLPKIGLLGRATLEKVEGRWNLVDITTPESEAQWRRTRKGAATAQDMRR